MIEIKNEASYSRIYQHTQDDSTFAIIGSQDQDTKKDRSVELHDLVRKLTQNVGHAIGFNEVNGTYTYKDGGNDENNIAYENSLIIYNIEKSQALDIANKINQESIVWKDKDFFGIIYADGSVMTKFSNTPGKNMSFTDSAKDKFGTKLKNDKNSKYGFEFEGTITYPILQKDKGQKEPITENFVFYGE